MKEAHTGRRGRKRLKTEERLLRKDQEKEQALRAEKQRCDLALARIIPRLKRWCKLSEVGIVFVADKEGKKTYYSLDGVCIPDRWGRPSDVPGYFTKWDRFHSVALESFAQIKKFQIHEPKNAMIVLAEAFAGHHDDI